MPHRVPVHQILNSIDVAVFSVRKVVYGQKGSKMERQKYLIIIIILSISA